MLSDAEKKSLLDNVLVRRFFVEPAFEIYGGVAGLYDLGPTACAIRNHLISAWRNFFVINDDMVEIQATTIVPEPVLVTSGHVGKFADNMVKDSVTGEPFRADKVIEDWCTEKLSVLPAEGTAECTPEVQSERKRLDMYFANADGLSCEETKRVFEELKITSKKGNKFSDPFPFNLMFKTSIGPASNTPAYLRPETAQGIFMNFGRAYEYVGCKLPFAIAQVGTSYRNEIAPRNGLLRVREFEQAEIEHFMPCPGAKHAKFYKVRDVKVALWPAERQLNANMESEVMTIGEAVDRGIVCHETIGYFMARTQQFLEYVGLDHARLRFRQHLPKQLAHYARDCWDCDCLLTCGWTEIVGIADRSAFDLDAHAKATGANLKAFVKYDTPITRDITKANPVMKTIAQSYRALTGDIKAYLAGLDAEQVSNLKAEIEANNKAAITLKDQKIELTDKHVTFTQGKETVHGEAITPNVCEPSFGVGRILTSILEHAFYIREMDASRTVFAFKPAIAPVKAAVLPLMAQQIFQEHVDSIVHELREAGISTRLDDSGANIGKRYARLDEIGIPFGVTVDHKTLEDDTVTLRERDSLQQIRLPVSELAVTIQKLCAAKTTWTEIVAKYGLYDSKADE